MDHIPSVDIVIVDYDAWNLVRDCLISIATNLSTRVRVDRVVVVENGTTRPEGEWWQCLHLPLHFIQNETNRGFAAACNQGAAGTSADFLLFLNPDTRLEKDSLEAPVCFLQKPENEHVGIVGIQLVDENGRVSRSCSRFPCVPQFANSAFGLSRVSRQHFPGGFMLEWDHLSTREVDLVIGAFFFVRSSLFGHLNGFDERFFVYFEDDDFAMRARTIGYRTCYLSDARCFHRGQGTTDKIKAERLFYSLRSRLQFGSKHFGIGQRIILVFVTLVVEPHSRLAIALARRSLKDVVETLRAYRLLWKEYILKRRTRSSHSTKPR